MSRSTVKTLMARATAVLISIAYFVSAAPQTTAPPGMFKDLNDGIPGDAIIVRSKQLFIDDYITGELKGVKKQLNQPVKHPNNPLVVPDERRRHRHQERGRFGNASSRQICLDQ